MGSDAKKITLRLIQQRGSTHMATVDRNIAEKIEAGIHRTPTLNAKPYALNVSLHTLMNIAR